jgi:hypothetical protein
MLVNRNQFECVRFIRNIIELCLLVLLTGAYMLGLLTRAYVIYYIVMLGYILMLGYMLLL